MHINELLFLYLMCIPNHPCSIIFNWNKNKKNSKYPEFSKHHTPIEPGAVKRELYGGPQ
jgi:hypothetical protein